MARESIPYILIGFLLTLLVGFINIYLSIIPLIGLLFVIYFFRDPHRIPPGDPTVIISPADGKIVEIKEIFEPHFIHRDMLRISIFLSIFDVHVNRSPVSGQVGYIQYQEGKFHNAMEGKSSIFNENNLIGINNSHSKILIKQIAGMIARRIICYCSKGDNIRAGDRIGLIKFGSRVEIYVPVNTEICIDLGQKVKAGESILGRLKEN